MYVLLPYPPVLEACAGRQTVWCSVKILSLFEWRVCCNQMNGLTIHGSQEIQVVAVKQCSVFQLGLFIQLLSLQ